MEVSDTTHRTASGEGSDMKDEVAPLRSAPQVQDGERKALDMLRAIMRLGERCVLPRGDRWPFPEFGGGKRDTREMFAFPWWMTRDIEPLLAPKQPAEDAARDGCERSERVATSNSESIR